MCPFILPHSHFSLSHHSTFEEATLIAPDHTFYSFVGYFYSLNAPPNWQNKPLSPPYRTGSPKGGVPLSQRPKVKSIAVD